MSSFNIQQQHRKMPASESAPLNAGLLKNDTGSSAIAVSLLNLHEPFPVLSKPFDHPRAYCSASAGALAQSVLRVPTATNPPHISNSKTQITHDMVDRPWAVQVAKQALTDSWHIHAVPANTSILSHAGRLSQRPMVLTI